MKFSPAGIPGVVVIDPSVHRDTRGYFIEIWHARHFAQAGLDVQFVQDNQSGSVGCALRGLHYQVKHPQGKLVRVSAGEIFDVAVDLRRSSPWFGRWTGSRLSAENRRQLYVPPGFAHGFLVIGPEAEVHYKCTDFYAPEHERTLLWSDPDIAIEWPLPVGQSPIVSAKDQAGTRLADCEVFP